MNLTKGVSSVVAFGMVASTALAAPAYAVPDPARESGARQCRAPGGTTALTGAEMDGTVGGDDWDAICYAALTCSAMFFPYGALICGPTAVVCIGTMFYN